MRVRRAEVVAGLLRILTPTPPDTKTKAPRRRRRRLNEMSRVRAHVRVNAAKEGGSNGCVVLDQKLLFRRLRLVLNSRWKWRVTPEDEFVKKVVRGECGELRSVRDPVCHHFIKEGTKYLYSHNRNMW